MNVPQIILSQLGGNRFVVMTGARDFTGSADTLTFKLPRISNGISHVAITLDVDDTYRVEFRKWNARKLSMAIVAAHTGIYCDMLQDLFTNETGLFTHL